MFDRLIESDTSDFEPRRRYFLISSFLVGLLFASAVVYSIYASEFGLGNASFELSELLPPNEMAQAAPEQLRPRTTTSTQTRDELPSRVIRQQDVNETPVAIPNELSTTPNEYQSRPFGDYRVIGIDRDNVGSNIGPPIPNTSTVGTGSTDSLSTKTDDANAEKSTLQPPPPVSNRPRNLGVVNGKASYLPKPPYPPMALSLGVQGAVTVQVTIDESGNVISAKAASGHPLLKTAAESAAWKAKFTPTYLSKVPVKVTGMIVYNFSKN
jgi:TonB family protein